jgi:hypothetical protein
MTVMANVAALVTFLALMGALASWIAGAVFYARTLAAIGDARTRWLAVVAWPFATARIEGAAAEHAARVNKALVAFLACLMIAAAAWSAAANLHRFAR